MQDTNSITCDLTAIPAEHRATHQKNAHALFSSAIKEMTELPDGYAFRFEVDQYTAVTQYIAYERRCCPFFTFVLEITPTQLQLQVKGSPEAKALLSSLLNELA